MHPLFNYITQYVTISEETFNLEIKNYFIKKRLRKKEYLLEEGEVCKNFSFIVKGAMRKYYVDEKGIEHVVNLYVENWWAGDRESFVKLTPSVYNVVAWEDCELFLISRDNTLKLLKECAVFNEFILKLDEQNTISTQKRITSSLSLTAEKSYEDFINNYPHFVQRFPQHIIASYLGITKDTLSRVRKKALKK
nr:Crp/Fnr family transcriptional regulator [uncultured Flavobacterium sp.]